MVLRIASARSVSSCVAPRSAAPHLMNMKSSVPCLLAQLYRPEITNQPLLLDESEEIILSSVSPIGDRTSSRSRRASSNRARCSSLVVMSALAVAVGPLSDPCRRMRVTRRSS